MKNVIPIAIVLAVLLIMPRVTMASGCQELAKQFTTDDASMSDGQLASLRSCVDKALRNRIFGGSPPPAPSPAPSNPSVVPPFKEQAADLEKAIKRMKPPPPMR